MWIGGATLIRQMVYDGFSNLIWDQVAGGQGDANYADLASTATGKGAALVGFLQSGTGAVAQTLAEKQARTLDVFDFIDPSLWAGIVNRTTPQDLLAPLNAAIAQALALGGAWEVVIPAGTYNLSASFYQMNPSIRVIGSGGDGNHDATSPPTGVVINWTGGAAPMVYVQTNSGSSSPVISGGAFCGVKLNCAGVATYGLICASVRGFNFENITIYDPVTAGLLATVVPLANEARDLQKNTFKNITVRAGAAASINAIGFLTGGDSVANCSFNTFENCDTMTQAGAGFKVVTADNNLFIRPRHFSMGAGGGIGIEVHGANTAGFESNSNTFIGASPGPAGIKLFGTITYTIPSKYSTFLFYDQANSSPLPTVETGATYNLMKSSGIGYSTAFAKLLMAQDDSALDAQRALITNESCRIYNASSQHVILADGAGNQWGIAIDGATGDLRFARFSGAGGVNVGNGQLVKMGNVELSQPAPTVPAGQVGFGNATATTVGAAGAASALPSAPVGYLVVNVAGTNYKLPYFNA